jgi:predicted nucleic acid-binding protein
MRIVLDTSVLVAAVRSETGASKVIIDLALARQFVLLMNYPSHASIGLLLCAPIM